MHIEVPLGYREGPEAQRIAMLFYSGMVPWLAGA